MHFLLSVPRLNIEMNKESNNVDLKFTDGTKPLPSVCIQYEKNGACQVGVFSV